MPVLIQRGGEVVEVDVGDEGWRVRRRPAWSYCSVQGKEKDAWAERKVERGPEEEEGPGGEAVGAGWVSWGLFMRLVMLVAYR